MSDPLSLDDVRALPEGTEVICTWSGGNGPHHYRVVFDGRGDPYLVSLRHYDNGPSDPMWFYNPVGTFVGPSPRTEIRLAAPSARAVSAASTTDAPDDLRPKTSP